MNNKLKGITRREFINHSSRFAFGIAGAMSAACATQKVAGRQSFSETAIQFGLVTYLWGKDWELPELIRNCQSAEVYGVELRVDHAHGVSPELSLRQQKEVRLRFENSPVELVGFGTNYEFHSPDKNELLENLRGAKEYVRLSHNLGSSGVKVKPNQLPGGVPVEKTIEQIGASLNELGEYAEGLGQEIRVEVHGPETSRLPVMAEIFNHVTQPNVGICWNSNDIDLEGEGLEHNFNLVKKDFGRTVHIRELGMGDYPYEQLFDLFVGMNYNGWILLEARTNPENRITALHQQKQLFKKILSNAG